MSNEVQLQAELPIVSVSDGEPAICVAGRSRDEIRGEIARLQSCMLQQQNIELTVDHEFLNGMYQRKLFIPKGTMLIGKIHKVPCLNIVAAGDIDILTEFGFRRVRAGFTGISPAGIQKLGYAHEDTVFINVFRTDTVDLEALEEELVSDSHDLLIDMEA